VFVGGIGQDSVESFWDKWCLVGRLAGTRMSLLGIFP
jgi:hypothetical protein